MTLLLQDTLFSLGFLHKADFMSILQKLASEEFHISLSSEGKLITPSQSDAIFRDV